MRLILIFDLPQKEDQDRKNYRIFRDFLIKNGFIMMQESVYSKLLLNTQNLNYFVEKIKHNLPELGKIMLIQLTEKQFNSIDYILGDNEFNVINNTDKVIVI